jgi:hypothetical protein
VREYTKKIFDKHDLLNSPKLSVQYYLRHWSQLILFSFALRAALVSLVNPPSAPDWLLPKAVRRYTRLHSFRKGFSVAI